MTHKRDNNIIDFMCGNKINISTRIHKINSLKNKREKSNCNWGGEIYLINISFYFYFNNFWLAVIKLIIIPLVFSFPFSFPLKFSNSLPPCFFFFFFEKY